MGQTEDVLTCTTQSVQVAQAHRRLTHRTVPVIIVVAVFVVICTNAFPMIRTRAPIANNQQAAIFTNIAYVVVMIIRNAVSIAS